MSIEITTGESVDVTEWDRLVANSPAGTPFHRLSALEVLADHTDTDLHTLVGYKGAEPVGLFPLFEKSRGPVSTVFSPPPSLKIPYLGPVPCHLGKLKTRKRHRRHTRFVEGCLDYLDETTNPRLSHFRLAPGYPDLRPFEWNDYDVTPRHTYVVDLDRDTDEIFAGFSSDARQNVRSVEDADADVEIFEGGRAVIGLLVDQVKQRHREQNLSYAPTPSFVRDLYRWLPEGVVRPYAVSLRGRVVGGMITLESEDTVYRWQGGATPEVDLPINDALDWHIISEAAERGRRRYDLVGANVRPLSEYKAKFATHLETYCSLQRATWDMAVLSRLYSEYIK